MVGGKEYEKYLRFIPLVLRTTREVYDMMLYTSRSAERTSIFTRWFGWGKGFGVEGAGGEKRGDKIEETLRFVGCDRSRL